MESMRIVGVTVLAAVLYGMIHDQITARICIEYFTVGLPLIVDSYSPTVQGLVWGVVATWWVGLLVGIPLALAARLGSWPRRSARSLIKPLAVMLGGCALGATVAGTIARRRRWREARLTASRTTP